MKFSLWIRNISHAGFNSKKFRTSKKYKSNDKKKILSVDKVRKKMKLTLCFVSFLLVPVAIATDDAPGYFLKVVPKNVPRVRISSAYQAQFHPNYFGFLLNLSQSHKEVSDFD